MGPCLSNSLYSMYGVNLFDMCEKVISFNKNKPCLEFSVTMNILLKKNFKHDYYGRVVLEPMSYEKFESILSRYWKCEEV